MEVNWIISKRKYRIVYKHYTKSEQPTSQSAPPPMADPGLSQSTIGSAYPPSSRPAASSGGSGGGKMKTLGIKIQASKKRPKKVKKSGIVHWMNDTFKSIAPSWLKKYFKKKDASEEEGAVPGTDQNGQSPPPPCPYCSEVGPLRLDGCDSPEPSTSSTEPSTSRASLNFRRNVLSPPPMSRSQLPFSPLEASSRTLGASSNLLPPPPTSSAPGPVSTGFSLVIEIKGSLSQPQDDNISTTCGFSSRASDKDVPTSKTVSLPKLSSREMDKANSRPQPTRSSWNNHGSNLSLFGAYSTLDTAPNSSQPGDSPLYPGKTRYDGRAASRSPHRRPETPCQTPVRRPITAKPARAQPCGVKRHTHTLESMSSPVADAKSLPIRVPNPPSPSMDGTNLDASHSEPQKKQSTLDRAALNSSQPGDSPLYPGKTRYVGRVASRSPHRRPETPCQSPVRRPITAKPARAQPCGVKRHTHTLESMSSPVADAKSLPIRVPNPPSPSMDGTNLDASHSEPQKKQSTLDRTAPNSSQLGDSPLYPGKTRYGGRAASRSPHRRAETPCQSPVRRPITAKPARAQPCGVKRHPARRYMHTLESISSPVAMDSNLPPVQKLMVPDAASVSGNRSDNFWPILTPGGEGRDVDMTPKETPTSKSPHLPMADPSPSHSPISSSDSPLSSTNAASSGGKPADKSEEPFKEVLMNNCDYDSAAAPDPPLVSDFCHGPAGAPPKDTSPTTTSTQKPSLFDNSYSSMQAEAPGSLEFGQTYTAPVGGLQFEGASEDWDPNPEPVWRPPHYTSSSSGDPTNTTSSTTTSTLKHSLFGYSYSSMQAPAPGSLEFGQPYTAPDSAAAPKTFFFSSAGDPTNTTSSTTTFFQ